MNKKIVDGINQQIKFESESSNLYLSMASWSDNNGYEGIAQFLYEQSTEERDHMLKLVHFLNERGGKAVIPGLKAPKNDFKNVKEIFDTFLNHEITVSDQINKLVELTLAEKDHITHNFLQWFVSEQMEEEKLARHILDKLNLTDNTKGSLYLFDRDIKDVKRGQSI